jgi:hypothetical protein
MILVAAVCILLTAIAVSAGHGGPGLVSGAAGCTVTTGHGVAAVCLSGAP